MTNPPGPLVTVGGESEGILFDLLNTTDEEVPVALNLVAVPPTTLPAHGGVPFAW